MVPSTFYIIVSSKAAREIVLEDLQLESDIKGSVPMMKCAL